jgi:hypothetical protein
MRMEIITTKHIDLILEAWAEGSMSEVDVHAWAEDRYAINAYEPESEAVNEVLAQLDQMDMNLLMRSDIPLLRKALSAQHPRAFIERIWSEVPVAERKGILCNVSFYRVFCQ